MQRKLLKGLAVFLVIIIIFGILTRISENLTVPLVEVKSLSSQVLEKSITLKGRVKKSMTVPVFTTANQRITGIEVRTGQSITLGTPLFSIDLDYLEEQIAEIQYDIDKLEHTIQTVREENTNTSESHQLVVLQAQEQYNQTVQKYDNSLAEAQTALENAQAAYQAYMELPENYPDVTEEELLLACSEKQSEYQALVEEREQVVLQAKQAVETAEQENVKVSDTTSEEIDLKQKQEEMEELVRLKEQGGIVTSELEGVVAEIKITTGSLTTDEAAFLIENTSSDNIVEVQTDAENETYLTGEVALQVTGTDEDGNALICDTASIAGKEYDENNPDEIEVTISLGQENFAYGSEVTVKIVQSSQKYENCIPASALHESKNGYYVLVVDKRQTFAGEEEIAMAVDVRLIEINGAYAAIEKNLLLDGEKIIVNANKTVGSGDKIRRKESASEMEE